MTFVLVVSAQEGLVTLRLTTPEALAEAVIDNLEQTQEIAAEVQSWAASAQPGEHCDAPFGWVFCVDSEPHVVAERAAQKAKARA